MEGKCLKIPDTTEVHLTSLTVSKVLDRNSTRETLQPILNIVQKNIHNISAANLN